MWLVVMNVLHQISELLIGVAGVASLPMVVVALVGCIRNVTRGSQSPFLQYAGLLVCSLFLSWTLIKVHALAFLV